MSYDFAAGAAARGAGLLRIGREATRGREAGVATQKCRNIFLPHYQTTKQKNFSGYAPLVRRRLGSE